MLTRRRFIEMGVATSVAGAAIGVGQDALAAGSVTAWTASTWQALTGRSITLIDAAGTTRRARVVAVTTSPAQANTHGEAFLVDLRGRSGTAIPDGLYRLRGGINGQVFLAAAGDGGATLTVNTVRARD